MPRRVGPLVWILGAGLAIRLLALAATHEIPLIKDEIAYAVRAEALLDGRGFLGSYQSWVRHPPAPMHDLPQYPGAYQPPLNTLFIAGAMALGGRSILAAKLAQVLLSTLCILLVFRLGRSWFGERTGLLAAGITAVYPNFVAFSHYLWSETLFMALLLPALELSTGAGLPSRREAAGAGLLLGLAALARSSVAGLLPLLGLWLLAVHRRQGIRAAQRAAVVLLAAGAVIAPWSVRCTLLHGGFVLVDTNGPYNLWRGNHPDTYAGREAGVARGYAPPFDGIPLRPVGDVGGDRLVRDARKALGVQAPTDLQITRYAARAAWGFILADPGGFLAHARYKLVDLWNPTSFLLRHFRLGVYGPVSPGVEATISWSAVLSYLAVVALSGIGAWIERRHRGLALVLLLAGYTTAIHVATFGLTRYRLPLMPLLILLAARALVTLAAARCARIASLSADHRSRPGRRPGGRSVRGTGSSSRSSGRSGGRR